VTKRRRLYRQLSVIGASVLLLAACSSDDDDENPLPDRALACEALVEVTAEASTITSATPVTSPIMIGGSAVEAPFCRVVGVARPSSDSEINFEVWLPPKSAWTGRMKLNGTGGFAGGTPYPRLAQDIGDGFVTAGSDMGHVGGESPDWTLGHPEKVKDWGLRAHYYVASAAKALSSAHYSEPVEHAYFEGCSNGGRQAMLMAQRYPELFDGIVAGAPSMFYPDTLMSLLWMGRLHIPALGQAPILPEDKLALISARVHASCDAVDGLRDGQITNPRRCSFDPAVLQCTGSEGTDCLSAEQVATVREIYRGPHTASGGQRWVGPVPGSETQWNPNFTDNGGYGVFVGHTVFSQTSPPFDWRSLNFEDDYDLVKEALTPITAAPSPDLTAFRERGGKLIQYHGWSDAIVVPGTSPNYFNAVAQFEALKSLPQASFDERIENLQPGDLASTTLQLAPAVQEYFRLFMMPEVGHCGGGTGPDAIGGGAPQPPAEYRDPEHHVVNALMRWVEEGAPPDSIIATKFENGTLLRERPLCPYPQEAVYDGSGDVNSVSSFSCGVPSAGNLVVENQDVLQVQNALRQRAVLGPIR
jgi:feruloyl esterase